MAASIPLSYARSELRTGELPSSPRVVASLRTLGTLTTAVVLAAGILSPLSWIVGRPLKSVALSPSDITKPQVALAFALLAAALLLKREERRPPTSILLAGGAAVTVVAFGLLDIAVYLLQHEPAQSPIPFGSTTRFGLLNALFEMRVPPIAAALLALSGLSILLQDVELRGGRRPAQAMCLAIALFTIAAFAVNLFGPFSPRNKGQFPVVTGPTSLLFIALSLSALFLRPDRGAMRAITAEAVGGEAARRLLPGALLAPPVLCILCYVGYQAHLYDSGFGLALLTTLNSAVLTTLVWRTGSALNETDVRRQATEAQRNELTRALQEASAFRENVMDTAAFAVVALDLDGRLTLANLQM